MRVSMGFEELRRLVEAALANNGYSRDQASALSEAIAAGERDGAVSHGLHRVAGHISDVACGWVDGHAVPAIVGDSGAVVVADGRNGYFHLPFRMTRELLADKAGRHGVATLAIRNCHHLSALWPEAEYVAERGLLALAFRSGRRSVLPFGGRRPIYGTNPMAFACPRRGGPPLVWDMASSFMARGDIQVAAKRGESVPAGAGVDRDGRPTTDPHAIVDGGAQLPFGGYKGSLISFMVEVVAAAATGSLLAIEDRSAGVAGAHSANGGELIVAIDPKATAGEDFDARVELLVRALDGNGEAHVPGARRHARRRSALAEGIPVDASELEHLRALAGPLAPRPASA